MRGRGRPRRDQNDTAAQLSDVNNCLALAPRQARLVRPPKSREDASPSDSYRDVEDEASGSSDSSDKEGGEALDLEVASSSRVKKRKYNDEDEDSEDQGPRHAKRRWQPQRKTHAEEVEENAALSRVARAKRESRSRLNGVERLVGAYDRCIKQQAEYLPQERRAITKDDELQLLPLVVREIEQDSDFTESDDRILTDKLREEGRLARLQTKPAEHLRTLWKACLQLYRCSPVTILTPAVFQYGPFSQFGKHGDLHDDDWPKGFCEHLVRILVHPDFLEHSSEDGIMMIRTAIHFAASIRLNDQRAWWEDELPQWDSNTMLGLNAIVTQPSPQRTIWERFEESCGGLACRIPCHEVRLFLAIGRLALRDQLAEAPRIDSGMRPVHVTDMDLLNVVDGLRLHGSISPASWKATMMDPEIAISMFFTSRGVNPAPIGKEFWSRLYRECWLSEYKFARKTRNRLSREAAEKMARETEQEDLFPTGASLSPVGSTPTPRFDGLTSPTQQSDLLPPSPEGIDMVGDGDSDSDGNNSLMLPPQDSDDSPTSSRTLEAAGTPQQAVRGIVEPRTSRTLSPHPESLRFRHQVTGEGKGKGIDESTAPAPGSPSEATLTVALAQLHLQHHNELSPTASSCVDKNAGQEAVSQVAIPASPESQLLADIWKKVKLPCARTEEAGPIWSPFTISLPAAIDPYRTLVADLPLINQRVDQSLELVFVPGDPERKITPRIRVVIKELLVRRASDRDTFLQDDFISIVSRLWIQVLTWATWCYRGLGFPLHDWLVLDSLGFVIIFAECWGLENGRHLDHAALNMASGKFLARGTHGIRDLGSTLENWAKMTESAASIIGDAESRGPEAIRSSVVEAVNACDGEALLFAGACAATWQKGSSTQYNAAVVSFVEEFFRSLDR